jgi:hypothetical protein
MSSTFAGEAALPTDSRSELSAAQISAGRASYVGGVAGPRSATARIAGSAGARSTASERLGDIASDAFWDRSTFVGRSSVATVEKSRLGVNGSSSGSDDFALKQGTLRTISLSASAVWVLFATGRFAKLL